mgnify:CR=1 FL=1
MRTLACSRLQSALAPIWAFISKPRASFSHVSQAFAMVVALHDRGLFAWDEWASALSAELKRSDADPHGQDYYEHWLAALERLLASKEVADAPEVEALAASGKRVLMVGDGLNDTAALAAAHVSISPASALEAARVVSDIVLLGKSLAPLGDALLTSRKATRRIKENFGIAATYNAIAIPVALLGFATPLAAALAMSASSIMVTLNALRLKVGK